jgi:ATP:corrinoid adenosyltransferase
MLRCKRSITGLGLSAYDVGSNWVEEGHFGEKTKVATAKALTGWAAVWAGTKIGASTGALFGSAVPGAGNGIGAIIGGLIGGVAAGIGADWIVDKIYGNEK